MDWTKPWRMAKELAWMGGRLCTRVPKENELGMHRSEFFPMRGYAYLMWCGVLVYRDEQLLNVSQVVLNHESIHLCQARAKGSWLRYYLCYLWELLPGVGFGAVPMTAYMTNPFEMEAYANQADRTFCENYRPENLRRYRMKHRRKVYAERKNEWGRVLAEARRGDR